MRPTITIYAVVLICIASVLMFWSGPKSQSGAGQVERPSSNIPVADQRIVWLTGLGLAGTFVFSGKIVSWAKRRRTSKFQKYMENQFKREPR